MLRKTDTAKATRNTAADSRKAAPSIPLMLRVFQLGFKLGGLVAPKLTACSAYRLWITPPRFKTPDIEKEMSSSARVDRLRLDERDIQTYHWGKSGPKVLLVHGWSGRGTQLGAFAAPLVDAGYQVISFDAPAHGRSSGKQTNIFQIADTIQALDVIHHGFDAVITHSFGGPCLALAMQNGFTCRCVVNIAPPALTSGLVNKFATTLSIPPNVENALMRCIENKFGEDIWEQTSMLNNINHLDTPALVIHDADDADVPLEEGEKVAESWRQVQFVVTRGLGHRRILRDAIVIRSSIDFIEQYCQGEVRHKPVARQILDENRLKDAATRRIILEQAR